MANQKLKNLCLNGKFEGDQEIFRWPHIRQREREKWKINNRVTENKKKLGLASAIWPVCGLISCRGACMMQKWRKISEIPNDIFWVSKDKTVDFETIRYLLEEEENKSKEIGLGFVIFLLL